MSNHRPSAPRLTGRSIAILMESDYVEPEIDYYRYRFAEEGANVVLLSRLWGQPSLTFTGHEWRAPITVSNDIETFGYSALSQLSAIIVPAGMVADRLRYSDDPATTAPAVDLLRRAFRLPHLIKGVICHGMWLLAPAPEVIEGRMVTCHNNLVADVRNMGAVYTGQDITVDGDLVTARTVEHRHLFARTIIDMVAARQELSQ